MIISNSQKYIFVHINKTAGTSVTRSLFEQSDWNDVILGVPQMQGPKGEEHYRNRFSLFKHTTAANILANIGKEAWGDYYKFSFVRNPYARAVSLYTFIRKLTKARRYQKYLRNLPYTRASKDNFWNWPATQAFLATKDFSGFIRNELALSDPGMKPQSNWLCDKNGQMLVDYVGKVETIQEDFASICRHLNLKEVELDNANRSNSKHWSEFYAGEADYEFVYELAKSDFDLFDYDANPT